MIDKKAQSLGGIFLNIGVKIYQSSFRNLPTKIYTFGEVKNICQENGLDIPQGDKDFNYYATTWESWKSIIETTLIDKIKWVAERTDCDNLALLFSSLSIILIGGYNTCGYLYCKRTNLGTGESVLHYANIIITSDRKVYLVEPASDRWVQVIKGQDIIMGNKKYEPIKAYFF